jgi:hypothetical protein
MRISVGNYYLSILFTVVQGGYCPLTENINTRKDHILGYEEYFFTSAELAGYPDRDKWECAHNWEEISNCTNGLCPLRKENGDSLMEMMSWEPYQASICDLAKTNTDKPKEPYKMNLFVFGSSMTAGSMTMGQCCEYMLTNNTNCIRYNPGTGDDYYCAWPGFFIRWIESSFPNADVNGLDFAISGYSSAHTAESLARFIGTQEITERDIIILDHSITDNGASLEVKEAMETIIRTIFRVSKGIMLPTIIVYDQWLFDHRENSQKPKNMIHPKTASSFYLKLAQHYKLPIWSTKRVIWSDYAEEHQKHFIRQQQGYGKHPPWTFHLFVADLLSLGFTMAIDTCKSSNMKRTYEDIPTRYYTLSVLEQGICDPSQPFLFTAYPQDKSNLYQSFLSYLFHTITTSADIDKYEKSLVGWTEYVDYHNVPGYIINNYANPENYKLSFVFRYPEKTAELDKYEIVLKYLTTHHNVGAFKMVICGENIDPPFDALLSNHATNKVSIPAIFTLSGSHFERCADLGETRLSIDFVYLPTAIAIDLGAPRGNEKVKILSLEVCIGVSI